MLGDIGAFLNWVIRTAEPLLSVPTSAWLVLASALAALAGAVYTVWYVARAFRHRWLAKAAQFETFKVMEATDHYIQVHGQNVASDMKSGTDVTISVLSDRGVKSATGTISRTYTYLNPYEIRIPRNLFPNLFGAADEADLSGPQKLKIQRAQRFFLERWWNHPNDNTQLQVRLAVYLTVITIVIGFAQGYVFEFLVK